MIKEKRELRKCFGTKEYSKTSSICQKCTFFKKCGVMRKLKFQ